jgi:hypothetical protein
MPKLKNDKTKNKSSVLKKVKLIQNNLLLSNNAATKTATTKTASTKDATTKDATTKNAATKTATTKNAATKTATIRNTAMGNIATDILTKKYLINGPNNVIRLVNSKINKVLYIFGDIHLNPNAQSECPISDNYESIDIDRFLLKFLRQKNTNTFDLFCEMHNDELIPHTSKNYDKLYIQTFRYKYIHQIRKLFQAQIEINSDKDNISKQFPNFRFHFSDIRNFIPNHDDIFYYYNIQIDYDIELHQLYDLLQKTEQLIINITNIKKYFSKVKKDKSVNKYLYKLLYVYKCLNIQKTINNIYEQYFIKNLDKILNESEDMNINIKSFINKILNDFIDKNDYLQVAHYIIMQFYNIKNLCLNIFIIITDLFFMRRFLDKDYITNAILYTGLTHMENILYLLVKYFDFTLSNGYYYNFSNEESKKTNKAQSQSQKISQIIKKLKSDNFEYLHTLSYHCIHKDSNNNVQQCVHLIDFPDNFS